MLFWIYFTVFLLASIASTQQGFEMGRDGRIVVAETFVNAIAAAGMVLYQTETRIGWVDAFWWVVAALISIAIVTFGILDVRFLKTNALPGVPEELQEQMVRFGFWAAILIFTPAVYFNWMLALRG